MKVSILLKKLKSVYISKITHFFIITNIIVDFMNKLRFYTFILHYIITLTLRITCLRILYDLFYFGLFTTEHNESINVKSNKLNTLHFRQLYKKF